MQFVQIKPCILYQSAQQQLKKAEEVKKVKEIKKEEPEDWQSVSIRYKILNKMFSHLVVPYCEWWKQKICEIWLKWNKFCAVIYDSLQFRVVAFHFKMAESRS